MNMLFKIAKLLLWIKQRLESRFKNRRKCFISKDIYVSNKKKYPYKLHEYDNKFKS